MILRIDHVAIAVRDYEKALRFFTDILGAIPGSHADDHGMKYLWQNFALGDLSRLELLTPTGAGSFLDNFLEDRQGGVHHITMQVRDIDEAKKILEENNIPCFGYNAYGTAWKELFIHPRDAFGVLIQMAQFNPDDWLAESVRMRGGEKFTVTPGDEGCRLILAHEGGGTAGIDLSRKEISELMEALGRALD